MALLSAQKGVALITAMLIVALVTAISVEVSWRFDLSLARSGNRWHGMQAMAYLQGGEALAKMALEKDAADTENDHAGEDWAVSAAFPTDEGYVGGKVTDAQGRLNLNDLGEAYKPNPNGQGTLPSPQKYSEAQRRFIRLLQTIDLGEETFMEQEQAEAILDSVKDWIDTDSLITFSGGAEADTYTQLDPPVTIANGFMASVSELQVINGIDAIIYNGLLPDVIALPVNGIDLNVNTVSLSVMRSLNTPDTLTPLSIEDGQSILGEIDPEEGMLNVNDLQTSQPNLEIGGLGTTSNYFLYFGEVGVGDHIKRSKSLLQRVTSEGETQVQTIRRTDSNF